MDASKQALEHVNSISQVSASRMSDLYSSFETDHEGRILGVTQRPDAASKAIIIHEVRTLARQWTAEQLALSDNIGEHPTDYEKSVVLARITVDAIFELAKTYPPDQLCLNCIERSLLAFEHLAEQDDNPRLEVVSLVPTSKVVSEGSITGTRRLLPTGPDHAFLVIGRDPDSDLRYPATWGGDTVICDPLVMRTYAAGSISEEMDLLSSMTNGSTRCELKIALPESTDYETDTRVLYRTSDGAGKGRITVDHDDVLYQEGQSNT